MSVVTLFAKIIEENDMWYSEFHGTSHWMRVRDNAMYLANKTNGDAQVAEYFSVLHTVCARMNVTIQNMGLGRQSMRKNIEA